MTARTAHVGIQHAPTYRVTLTRQQWDTSFLAVRRWSDRIAANKLWRVLTADDAPQGPTTPYTTPLSAYLIACIAESLDPDTEHGADILRRLPSID